MKIVADKNIPYVQACFSHLGEVELMAGREMTASRVGPAEILLVRSVTKVNEALLANSRIQFVATATIGVEHVDQAYLADRGIGFSSAPGSNANSVAEYVAASLLTIAEKYELALAGKSIGIVGVGNVGSRVAAKCAALGLEVVLNDPPLARQTGDSKYRPLSEIMACDFVTMHTPLTYEGQDKSFHLAGETLLSALKPGAVFMNSSRGGVHDTVALKECLATGRLMAVGLDVWEGEPRVDTDLLQRADIVTPHIAGYSFDGKVAGLIMIYQAACQHLGITPRHTASDFLPVPEVPDIRLSDFTGTEQQVLHQVVQQVYTIGRDDQSLREMIQVLKAEQGDFFDALRKNYPRRREFQNTRVLVDDPECQLAVTLAGIGFAIVVKQG
jgi:erythronate-4-phosphate dehydrogenase